MAAVDGRIVIAKDGRDGPSTSKGRALGLQEMQAGTMRQSSLTDLAYAPSKSASMATSAVTGTTAATTAATRERKIGHRRVDETTGQVTYKKKTTTDLMKAIQLGIGQSVGSLTSKPERDVLMQDFSVVETVNFPENGSNLTPAHRVGEFKFKTYAPVAFRYFRELFGIHMDDFLVSLCSDTLTELSNPGASGSIFFITEDDEFIIKTVQHKEAEFLQKLLPGYYMNLNQNPRTLLPKFYGLHCYQQGGKNIRFVIMNNLLPSSVKLHEKYDLKGSTHKRKASRYELAKALPTLKDLDFRDRHPEGLLLEPDMHEALLKTIRRDCRVLESFKIMDYSLLLGIHNIDQARRERSHTSVASGSGVDTAKLRGPGAAAPPPPSSAAAAAAAAKAQALSAELAASMSEVAYAGAGVQRNKSIRQRLANFSTAMESIQAEADVSVDAEDDEEATPAGGIPAKSSTGDRVLLYVGVIDILQSYRLKKKLEHGFKSIVHDGDTISVHRPGFYAQRFQNFFDKEVFKKLPAPQRSPSRKKLARQRSLTESGPESLATGPGYTAPRPLGAAAESGRHGGLSSSRPDLIAAAVIAHREVEPLQAVAATTGGASYEAAAASSASESRTAAPAQEAYERKHEHNVSVLSAAAAPAAASTGESPTVEAEGRATHRTAAINVAAAAAASPGPPVGGDHLPPYSEQPAVEVQPAAGTAAAALAAASGSERPAATIGADLSARSVDMPSEVATSASDDTPDDSHSSSEVRSLDQVVVTIRLSDSLLPAQVITETLLESSSADVDNVDDGATYL